MIAFAPSPEDLAWAAVKFILLPGALLWVIIGFRSKPIYLLVGALPIVAFYTWMILDHSPATSFNRQDVLIRCVYPDGAPASGIHVEVTLFRPGSGHYLSHSPSKITGLTNSDGEFHFFTKNNIRASFRITSADTRWVSAEFDRRWGDYPRTWGFSWAVEKQNEKHYRSNTTGVSTRTQDRRNFTFTIVVPRMSDSDFEVEKTAQEKINANNAIHLIPTRVMLRAGSATLHWHGSRQVRFQDIGNVLYSGHG